jgi:peptide deformylase
MALRRIWTIDNPAENKILRARAKKISRFDAHLQKLVDDMFETMRAAPGVGLAGPQIGETIRVLVAEYEDERVALVNPEIIKRSDDTVLGTEGCLSIPGVVGDDVPRAEAVTIKARDPHGKEIRIKAEGWFARILQHEIDHLDGILFTDHIPAAKVREVRPDEVIEEGEVEQIEPPKNGKNGSTLTKRPEHNEHAETEKAAETATSSGVKTQNPAKTAMPPTAASQKAAETARASTAKSHNAAEMATYAIAKTRNPARMARATTSESAQADFAATGHPGAVSIAGAPQSANPAKTATSADAPRSEKAAKTATPTAKARSDQ